MLIKIWSTLKILDFNITITAILGQVHLTETDKIQYFRIWLEFCFIDFVQNMILSELL